MYISTLMDHKPTDLLQSLRGWVGVGVGMGQSISIIIHVLICMLLTNPGKGGRER